MVIILIVGNDRESQTELAASLRARGHSVLISDYREFSLSTGAAVASEIEIAIFNVTSLTKETTAILHRFCLGDLRDKRTPLVLCYSRVNYGPKFELAIERLGARFAYA